MKDSKRYELYVRRRDAGIAWKFRDCGVTISDERIEWELDGEPYESPLGGIAEVHLQTGAIPRSIIATCRIRFTEGFELLVLSSNEDSLYDAGQAAIYSAFARDLNGRLAALEGAAIAFTAGYSNTRRNVGIALIVICVAFFLVMPTVLLVISRELSLIPALYFGVLLVWPLWRIVTTNQPQTYDPRALPIELVDT